MPLPRFGEMIRGARLMFHWSLRFQAMMRLSPTEDERFTLMELYPPNMLPSRGGSGLTHYCWWENESIERDIVVPEHLGEITRPVTILIDELGFAEVCRTESSRDAKTDQDQAQKVEKALRYLPRVVFD